MNAPFSTTVGDVVIGVDTGGTFTDVTLLDPQSGAIWNAKTPSTPDDPSRGFAEGLRDVLRVSKISPSRIGRVLHGTTVATNLILEEKGPATAMLTTFGFRFVVEIGRQDVPRGENLHTWIKPRRPVSPKHIWEVRGRIDPQGTELEPLDEGAVRHAARAIMATGIRSVAIVFLNSYADSTHEKQAERILREECPDLIVSRSSQVLPIFREFERSMTTNLNAYVMSAVASYVAQLEAKVNAQGISAPLLLMKSSGGVTSARTMRERPVESALSGPAAGVVGAKFIGEGLGERNIIGIDIGGTSADISLIHQGEIGLTTHGRIGSWPIGLPMVDIATIGAGGGSIARISSSGGLSVGPESSGAIPGPVCYRRGGKEPTVTDAHLVLGHLPPYLLSGSLALDLASAQEAIRVQIAEPLGLTIVEAARGILHIADNNMVGAIRVVSVERGFDPRDFALLPFGGAGPLHAGSIARAMGIKTIVVPPAPGVLSALGLMVSNLKSEFARTCFHRSGGGNPEELTEAFTELETDAIAWLDLERVPPSARNVVKVASLRYQNQGFELTIPWATHNKGEESLTATFDAFHDTHERMYGFAQRDTTVEITTVRVDAIGSFAPPVLPAAPAHGRPADAMIDQVTLMLETGSKSAPVYDRLRLGVGETIEGPCVVSQLDTTTLLLPGQIGKVHRLGSLIINDCTA